MSKVIATVADEYRSLPLSQLQESPTNPRRRFDERALQELAASFATQGILQPLLVRAIDDGKYEVVAGARRFRAAQLAALKEVPVRVVELSDAAVRESQLTENLLREGVHRRAPLNAWFTTVLYEQSYPTIQRSERRGSVHEYEGGSELLETSL